ncbi:uncharacterized protein MAM_07493 [Metarhizium album ARSEF 1941]|uniref:Uncharacterized protein n=1 Tax=Metarhizium album (strain ARSEF 1941) TaxID=1081103 RepID=A0A0B2WM65_METAS|nr:uncharacterized protein MAM_07493 [Metarhizium album ARSEF 1941]KHN94587.1 hypothetical protein MAM_07493 [Metarhizium album ARSEF 1941]
MTLHQYRYPGPSTFTACQRAVHDSDDFLPALCIILDYLTLGSSRVEVVRVRGSASAWCARYFRTRRFALLRDHPDLFNVGEPAPSRATRSTTWSTWSPSGRRVTWEFRPGADHHAHLGPPPMLAADLSGTSILWNIPAVMTSLARANVQAPDECAGRPMFIDPPCSGFAVQTAARAGPASPYPSDMSVDGSSCPGAMALDSRGPDDAAAAAPEDMDVDTDTNMDMDMDMDIDMGTAESDAQAEEELVGEAMEGVEESSPQGPGDHVAWFMRTWN